ncbi:MAG TPA: hypothetical protein PKY40_16130 [Burkholderiaceae bacterium]|nr:hypothetical protein [Burkholderiaceae bacterium]
MKSTPTLPDPEKEALWRGRVAAQAASGLTVRDWCQQAGYSDSLFHYWKSTIAKRDGTYTPPPLRKASAPKPAAMAAPAFAQVVVSASKPSPAPPVNAPASAVAANAIEIVLPGLRVVRVNAGFDAATLARVLDLLEERPC